MKMWNRFAVLAAALVLTASPTLAQQADMGVLMDRLERLERDIRALHIQVSRGGAVPVAEGATAFSAGTPVGGSEAMARLSVRITAIDDELRSLTGRLEESAFHFNQVNQRLDQLIGDVDYRLSALEGRAPGQPGVIQQGAAPAPMSPIPAPASVRGEGMGTSIISGAGDMRGTTPPRILGTIRQSELRPPPQAEAEEMEEGTGLEPATAPADGQPPAAALQTQAALRTQPAAGILPAGSSREQYAYAFGLLRRAEYDQAEVALTEFIAAHGDDPLAVNARYWLGEAHYVRADYVRAAEAFLQGYQDSPKGPKAPDTLLKLGMSLGNLDKKAPACAAFGRLDKEFPDASPIIQKKLETERERNACQ